MEVTCVDAFNDVVKELKEHGKGLVNSAEEITEEGKLSSTCEPMIKQIFIKTNRMCTSVNQNTPLSQKR